MKKKNFFIGFSGIVIFLGILIASIAFFSSFRNRRSFISLADKIGVIEIRGVITNSMPVLKILHSYQNNPSIKGILIRIESPGGGVGPSQEIYREVRRTVKIKPVVASLGGVAASGGYYIASAASKIMADPGTLTGSIGVIINLGNLSGLFHKIGYKPVTIKSGKFKDIGNPGREMTPEEKKFLQHLLDNVHQQFIQDVAIGRKLPIEKVERIADGRIFSGEQAKKLHLVDALGNFQDAINMLADIAKIKGKPKLIYPSRRRLGLFDLLFRGEISNWLLSYVRGDLMPIRYQLEFQ